MSAETTEAVWTRRANDHRVALMGAAGEVKTARRVLGAAEEHRRRSAVAYAQALAALGRQDFEIVQSLVLTGDVSEGEAVQIIAAARALDEPIETDAEAEAELRAGGAS